MGLMPFSIESGGVCLVIGVTTAVFKRGSTEASRRDELYINIGDNQR